MNHHLGIDFGKVIISDAANGSNDTSFFSGSVEQALQTPPNIKAFEEISALVDMFDGQVWIISKANQSTQKKTRAWLKHWDFFQCVDLPWDRLRFCLKREDKLAHCTALEISHFIDDRLDVLTHLHGMVPHLYLFGEQPGNQQLPGWVTPVTNWPAARDQIAEDLKPKA